MFYKWNKSTLQLYNDGAITDIVFPEELYEKPVFNNIERYIAVPAENKIYIYDCQTHSFKTLMYKSKYIRREIIFDKYDKLYYIDGNNIGVMNTKDSVEQILYNIGRTPHNPQNLGVSPDGRFVSFCWYRSDNLCLYLFDMQTGELKDYKISLSHYAWLDNEHIVWSKYGSLKVLDINTGKSQLIVKDHKSLIKINKENAKLFDSFTVIDRTSLYTDLDLLQVLNNEVYFSLAISCYRTDNKLIETMLKDLHEHGIFSSDSCSFNAGKQKEIIKHYGIWSVNPKNNTATYHFEFSADYIKAIPGHKFLMNNGNLAWKNSDWHISDGKSEISLSGDWKKAVLFDSLNA